MQLGERRETGPRRSASATTIERLSLLCLLGICAVGVLGAWVAPPASASHFDNMFQTNNTYWDCVDQEPVSAFFCQTDNRTLGWFEQGSITNNGRQNLRETLEISFEATVLSVSRDDSPAYTGLAETDIIYQEGALPSGVVGATWCDDAVSNRDCDQHYVRFRDATPGKQVICHESGHAVGLTHGQDAAPRQSNGDNDLGCMQTPLSEVNNELLGSHNKVQINGTY